MEENLAQLPFDDFISKCSEQLHEAIQVNEQMRMKYPTETEKFYSSEESINSLLNLFEEKLQMTESSPQVALKLILSSKVLVLLLRSMEHPNADINICAVTSFHSLIIDMNKQIDEAEQNEEENGKEVEEAFPIYFRMCIWLLENGFVEKVFNVINKLNQEVLQEYEGVRKILKIYEHLIELSDQTYPLLLRQTKIIPFLANRIMPNFTVSHRTIDDNKFIASDILIMMLETPQPDSNTVSAVRQLYNSSGVEVLIETMSCYEKSLPTLNDEKEYLNNLFDCLNALLVSVQETRLQFHQMKGMYLMISYICTKTPYAVGALKSISNSLNCSDNPQVNKNICEDVANDGGLKYLFPMLMRQGIKGQDIDEQTEIYENLFTIFYFLAKYSESVTRDRIINKFSEKRFAKLERLFELRGEYYVENERTLAMEVKPEDYIKMISEDHIGMVETIDKLIATLYLLSPQIKAKTEALMSLYGVQAQQMQNVIGRNYRFIDEGAEKLFIEKLLNENLRLMSQIGKK